MEEEEKRKVVEEELEELFIYGETLNTPEIILKEASLFQKWYKKQPNKKIYLDLDRTLQLFSKKRPWGKDRRIYASDLIAVRYAFMYIDDPPCYIKEIHQTSEWQRFQLYDEFDSKRNLTNKPSIKQSRKRLKLENELTCPTLLYHSMSSI